MEKFIAGLHPDSIGVEVTFSYEFNIFYFYLIKINYENPSNCLNFSYLPQRLEPLLGYELEKQLTQRNLILSIATNSLHQ